MMASIPSHVPHKAHLEFHCSPRMAEPVLALKMSCDGKIFKDIVEFGVISILKIKIN